MKDKNKNKKEELSLINHRKRNIFENPTLLFIILGILTISIMLVTYFVAVHYQEPEVVIISITVEAAVMVFIGGLIIKSVDRLALADEIKSEFISIASHQLRTPLSIMNWSLDFLSGGKAGSLSTDQLEVVNAMKQSNQGMIKLVNDLLNVSRIEMGRIRLSREQFSLVKLIREIVNEYKYFAKASNVSLNLYIKGDIPNVFCDRGYTKQAVVNILDNAIKYVDNQGRVSISISCEDSKVLTEIKDTGIGIPKEEQKRVFDKFFRSHNIIKTQTKGSGLGLYITRAIIKESGGKIGFISKEGYGTTFWFTLPASKI